MYAVFIFSGIDKQERKPAKSSVGVQTDMCFEVIAVGGEAIPIVQVLGGDPVGVAHVTGKSI